MHPGVVLACAAGAMLLAAKAHGREVRLERERAGYHSVRFGGENPPFVEALWRRDRIGFWIVAPTAALALGALAWPTGSWLLRVAAAPAGLTVGFVAMGLASLARKGRPGAVSVAWWAAVAAVATLTAWLAYATV